MVFLVIVEYNGNIFLFLIFSIIIVVKVINSDIDIFMLGYGIESIVVKVSYIQGIFIVFIVDSLLFEYFLVENVEKQISYFLNSGKNYYQFIFFFVSFFGKNCVLCLVVKFDVFQISDIMCVID